MVGGCALDALASDEPAAHDLLHEDLVRSAVEESAPGASTLKYLRSLSMAASRFAGAAMLSYELFALQAMVIVLPSYQRLRPSPAPRWVLVMRFGRCTATSESLVA